MTYSERANRYAADVLSGSVVACKWVRLACVRHKKDIAAGVYLFDPERADRACKFIELFPHTKGKWAAKRQGIKLEDWQCFSICSIFGWLNCETGQRRFRKAYFCVPRKNGKSIIAGGIGNYMFLADGEFGPEVYSGAVTEKQAFEVFRPAKQMIDRTPAIKERFGVFCGAKGMSRSDNGARFEVVIGNPGDGASPSCGIVDEYHEHPTDSLVDTFVTGMGAREQPLLLIITTAGSNIAGPCRMFQADVEKILEGSAVDEETFGVIYSIDEGDDWTGEEALRKANPNYDISVFGSFLKAQQAAAIRYSGKQNIFKTKHLNIWVNAAVSWMNMEKWNKLADAPPETEMKGQACWICVDLASKIDIAARVKVFRKSVSGVDHYYGYCTSYLPEERAEDPECQHYQSWMHDGHLLTTPGNAIDYETIQNDTVADIKLFKARELGFDPWNAAQFAQNIAKERVTCVEIPQQVRYLSEPMKEIESLVADGRFHHDGNPVFTWMMSNVICHTDNKENIFPRKERPESKIDGAVALIMAMSRALLGNSNSSIYSQRGLRVL